jgi:hypothetical protein
MAVQTSRKLFLDIFIVAYEKSFVHKKHAHRCCKTEYIKQGVLKNFWKLKPVCFRECPQSIGLTNQKPLIDPYNKP